MTLCMWQETNPKSIMSLYYIIPAYSSILYSVIHFFLLCDSYINYIAEEGLYKPKKSYQFDD